MATPTKVAKTSDIPLNCGRVFVAAGKELAVFNLAGVFHALANTCLHRGGPLGEGALEGSVVTCPWHGWRYDVTTGRVLHQPERGVACYEVRVEGEDLFVAL